MSFTDETLLAALASQGLAIALIEPESDAGAGARVLSANATARALGDDAALAALATRALQGPAVTQASDGRTFEARATRAPNGQLVLSARPTEDGADLRRRLARSDELLRVGAHELRNPLHVIGMICHLLETRTARGEALDRGTLDRLGRQVERMNHLITQLLDLSRAQDGRLQLDMGDVDLVELVRDNAARVPPQRAGDLHLRLAERAPLRGDERRLHEVVHQLLDNAARFSEPQTPIEVDLVEQPDAWVLRVADVGPGIAPEDRPSLFQRDVRIDSKRGPQGLAVGLYIAANVVRLHGGTLEFQPNEPRGAIFTLRLPR